MRINNHYQRSIDNIVKKDAGNARLADYSHYCNLYDYYHRFSQQKKPLKTVF